MLVFLFGCPLFFQRQRFIPSFGSSVLHRLFVVGCIIRFSLITVRNRSVAFPSSGALGELNGLFKMLPLKFGFLSLRHDFLGPGLFTLFRCFLVEAGRIGFYLVGHQGFLFNYDLAILLYFQTLVVAPHFPHGLGVHLLFI